MGDLAKYVRCVCSDIDALEDDADRGGGDGPSSRGDGSFWAELQEGAVVPLPGAPFGAAPRTGTRPRDQAQPIPLNRVRLLSPCQPSKIIAVGLNYQSHLQGRSAPQQPGLFTLLPTCVIGTGETIVMPPDATDVHYEGEMVLVIGRRTHRVSRAQAAACVFGVTCGNDVSERNWQRGDLQWVRAKASDTFAPIGPALATGLDYGDLELRTRVNGELRQSANTSDLIFDVATLISYISRYVTLLPGDLVFTGTPGTTEAMQPGDVVEVELDGVGVLRNDVARDEAVVATANA